MTPAYDFKSTDNGVHIFSGIDFANAGFQTVTAFGVSSVLGVLGTVQDATSVTGTLLVTVSAASATHFTLSGASTAGANAPFSVTLSALDTNNNIATGYTGTVKLTPTDSGTVNAQQTITFSGTPTSGTFTLTFAGHTTGNINYSTASTTLASNIQSALTALTGIVGSGNSVVSASNASSVNVTFQGTLAGQAEPTMIAANSLLGTSRSFRR